MHKPKKPKLGSGKRFKENVEKIQERHGLSKEAASAVMANAGRKKYGSSKMAKLSALGRKTKK
jgi:hypothetical protein